jgi:hypothetical protein
MSDSLNEYYQHQVRQVPTVVALRPPQRAFGCRCFRQHGGACLNRARHHDRRFVDGVPHARGGVMLFPVISPAEPPAAGTSGPCRPPIQRDPAAVHVPRSLGPLRQDPWHDRRDGLRHDCVQGHRGGRRHRVRSTSSRQRAIVKSRYVQDRAFVGPGVPSEHRDPEGRVPVPKRYGVRRSTCCCEGVGRGIPVWSCRSLRAHADACDATVLLRSRPSTFAASLHPLQLCFSCTSTSPAR